MITAISSVNQNSSKVGFKKQASLVSFTGSPLKLGEGVAEKAAESTGKAFRKLATKELPFIKKPLIAPDYKVPVSDPFGNPITDGEGNTIYETIKEGGGDDIIDVIAGGIEKILDFFGG